MPVLAGEQAKGLNANVIVKLKESWSDVFKAWTKREPRAKSDLHEIWNAATRDDANKAFGHDLKSHAAKSEGASECLETTEKNG